MGVQHYWYDMVSTYSHENTLRHLYRVDRRILVGGAIAGPPMRDFLRSLGITHVISADDAKSDAGLWDPSHAKWVPWPDNGQPVPQERLHTAARFIEEVLRDRSRTLYCHCALGMSRGPALGYLALRVGGMSAPMAHRRVYRPRGHEEAGARKAQLLHEGWVPTTPQQYIDDIERCLATFVGTLVEPLRA